MIDWLHECIELCAGAILSMQSLLPSSHTALCTFVRELLHPKLQLTVMNCLTGNASYWLETQLRSAQAMLIAASNQVCVCIGCGSVS